ncbi:MAG: hypothetical protein ACK559_18075, partial [bacterium]
VDRHHQVLRGDVTVGALEHACLPSIIRRSGDPPCARTPRVGHRAGRTARRAASGPGRAPVARTGLRRAHPGRPAGAETAL